MGSKFKKKTRNSTFGQRLNTALLLLILLLMVGFGLVLWMREALFSSDHRSDQLSYTKDRLLYDTLLAGESVRTLALEPKNEAAKKSKREADIEMAALNKPPFALPEGSELRQAFDRSRDFIIRQLVPFHSTVLEIADTSPTNAAA